jgi:salicylate hydroxylase
VSQSDFSTRKEKINRALTIYERARHQRVLEIQKTSREAGLLYEFQGVGGEGDDLEKIARNLQGRMGWIWEWDIESELKKALKSLSEESAV